MNKTVLFDDDFETTKANLNSNIYAIYEFNKK